MRAIAHYRRSALLTGAPASSARGTAIRPRRRWPPSRDRWFEIHLSPAGSPVRTDFRGAPIFAGSQSGESSAVIFLSKYLNLNRIGCNLRCQIAL